MFKEILWFKPQLEPAAAKKLERSLVDRFGKVAKKFGSGLTGALKGSLFGLSLGLLTKLLNPIEAVQEKLTALLNSGRDTSELASRFGSGTGEFLQLQKVAEALGVNNEDLNGMLEKFANALQSAEKEFRNLKPGELPSASAALLKQFVGSENIVQAFKEALQAIDVFGVSPAKFEGKKFQGPKARQLAEEEIFGERFTGAMARLAGANIGQEAARLRLPTVERLGRSNDKLAGIEEVQRALRVRNQANDFVNASGNTKQQFALDIERRRAEAEAILTQQIAGFQNLSRTADAVNALTKTLEDARGWLLSVLTPIVEWIPKLTGWVAEIAKSPLVRNGIKWFGGGK